MLPSSWALMAITSKRSVMKAESGSAPRIQIKRVYDSTSRADGTRILVERLWPRGIKKEALGIAWIKEVAPTTELRQWFGHDRKRWAEFRQRYERELDANPSAWQPILDAAREGTVTLIYSARDTLHNGALVLRDYLLARLTTKKIRPTTKAK